MIRSLGILGGTFDPVHKAHIDLARKAMNNFGLDSVLFIPAKEPPHKDWIHASYDHRVKMVELAIKNETGFLCSRLEEGLDGPSYTIKTIQLLRKLPDGVEDIFFIVGLDTFNDIKSWYRYEQVLALIHFIVAGRKGHDASIFFALLKELGYKQTDTNTWLNRDERKVEYLDYSPPEIASSTIREKFALNKGVDGLLPPAVEQYIRTNELYGCNPME